MKFKVSTVDFKNALTKMEKVLPKKAALPVLENVKISVQENSCCIYATDLEQYVKTNIEAYDSTGDAAFVFSDTKSLIKAIKFFNGYDISFEVRDGSVMVQCGDKKANLKTMDASYPNFPEVTNKSEEYSYTADKLSERFNLVKYAVSTNENRPIMTGVHFDGENMVTCDAYRMAVNKDSDLSFKTRFTVTTRTLELCRKILDNKIMVGHNDKYITFEDANTTVIARLIEGLYLDYKSVIPNMGNSVKVNVKDYTDSLKYLKTFIENKTDYVAWKANRLMYRAAMGEYEATISMTGEFDYTIGFNVDYMLDCLTQFEDDVEIVMGESNVKPMLFKQGSNTALVLPARLKEDPFTTKAAG